MPSNKPRLYIALYASKIPDNEQPKYHWAFILAPKNEQNPPVPGTQFYLKNTFSDVSKYPHGQWAYEEVPLANAQYAVDLLARILIGKVQDEDRLVRIIRSVPVIPDDRSWRCRTWCADVLKALTEDGKAIGTGELDWTRVEAAGRDYTWRKIEAGRYSAEEAEGRRKRWEERWQNVRSQTQGGSSSTSSVPPSEPAPTYDLIEGKEIFD